MKKNFLFTTVLILAAALFIGGCREEKEVIEKFDDAIPPRFVNVSVHDPSIFRISGTGEFRIIGSFLTSAKTFNFISWSSDSTGATNAPAKTGSKETPDDVALRYPLNLKYIPKDNPNPGIQTVAQQMTDVLRGQFVRDNGTLRDAFNYYASDIHSMPNGKFFHYYSMTCTSNCSAIGVAIADSAEGPYITQGLIVRSNQAADNSLAPDGTTNYSTSKHPNCIDAQAFFDKTGTRLFMTYGSWTGGIFICEMDPETGLKKDGAAINNESDGYGRRIIAAQGVAIEAPYILYSPKTDYYYLFLSFGWLESVGNAQGRYQIRIFRSQNPEGPYEDAIHPITESAPKPLETVNLVNSSGDTDFRNYGVKVMGGYHFPQLPEEARRNSGFGSEGYLAMGHNSAYYDQETGKYYLIFHSRFVNSGEQHSVRVHEMFVSENGWLMAAPFRYDSGTIRSFSKGQLTSTWKILCHGRSINQGNDAYAEAKVYTFKNNGAITGPENGKWEMKADGKTAYITLDDVLYKGVFLRSYDELHRVWVCAFTAMSDDGIALWGATPGI